jgi:hypothetical protein
MNNENKIMVLAKNVYGRFLFYPLCDKSRAFAALTKKGTLTPDEIVVIREVLGFEVIENFEKP